MRSTFLATGLLAALAACGGSQPTQPSGTATATGPAGAPIASITVKADAAGSRDAVASLSTVIVDASASSGVRLAYAIDFGDGSTATTAAAQHVYATPATYAITATVTDQQGRKATATASIGVHDVTGSWYEAGFAQQSKRIEVRRIIIEAQSGTGVRGTYQVTGAADKAFTGTLTAPRNIRLVTDGGVTLEGTLPSKLNDETELWTLLDHGDGADGQRLDFHAIVGAPDGSPPTASLKMSIAGGLIAAITGVTPVNIDAGASRGSELAYFVDYGDGFVATTPQAERAVEAPAVPPSAQRSGDGDRAWNRASATARVTVVDRFGRTDTTSVDYHTFDFGFTAEWGDGPLYWSSRDSGTQYLWVRFEQRSGSQYGGTIAQGDGRSSSFTLTVTGGTNVHVSAPALGAEFDGTVSIRSLLQPNGGNTMTLVQHGGAFDGKTYVVWLYSSY